MHIVIINVSFINSFIMILLTERFLFVCFVLFFVVIIILFCFFVLEKWRSSSAPYHTPVFMYHPVSLLALRRKTMIDLSSCSQSPGSERKDDN